MCRYTRCVNSSSGSITPAEVRPVSGSELLRNDRLGGIIHECKNGALRHAALRHGEGLVLLQPDLPDELHGTHVGHGWVYVAVVNPDAHFKRAKAAGAEVLGEPHDAVGGMRGYSARDLEGNLWSFGTDRPGR